MSKKEIAKTIASALWLAITLGAFIFGLVTLSGSGFPAVALGPEDQVIPRLSQHIAFNFGTEMVTAIVVIIFFYAGVLNFVIGLLFCLLKRSLRFLPLPFASAIGFIGGAYFYEAYLLIKAEPGMVPLTILILFAVMFVLGFLALVFETNWPINLKKKKPQPQEGPKPEQKPEEQPKPEPKPEEQPKPQPEPTEEPKPESK